MKINKNLFYSRLFIVVLLLQLYLPSFKINLFFQLAVIILYFFFEFKKIPKLYFKKAVPLLILLFVGFIGTIINGYDKSQIIKDFFHFLKPVLGILIGYLFYKKIDNYLLFIKNVILAGFISAIIHFIILIFFADLSTGSVNSLREFSRDNFLELTSLFFLVGFKKIYKKNIDLKYNKIYLLVLILSCSLYLSRTMFLVSFVFIFSIFGYTKFNLKGLKIILVFMVAIGLFYTYLFSVKIDRNKAGIESFLYKVKIAPSELFNTKIDRENHKDLWDHWRGYEAKRALVLMEDKPISYIIGTGFGSLVNLKFKAPLDGEKKGMKYISELHNGYVYVLYKTGFFGLLIYFFFLISLYKEIYKKEVFETVFISAIGIIYLITTLTITGLFNNRDVFVFILGGLLVFNSKKKGQI